VTGVQTCALPICDPAQPGQGAVVGGEGGRGGPRRQGRRGQGPRAAPARRAGRPRHDRHHLDARQRGGVAVARAHAVRLAAPQDQERVGDARRARGPQAAGRAGRRQRLERRHRGPQGVDRRDARARRADATAAGDPGGAAGVGSSRAQRRLGHAPRGVEALRRRGVAPGRRHQLDVAVGDRGRPGLRAKGHGGRVPARLRAPCPRGVARRRRTPAPAFGGAQAPRDGPDRPPDAR